MHFVSRLPQNDIGQAALGVLRSHGILTDGILRGGERLGIYYMENGASVRPGKVIYDRSHSAFSGIKPEDLDYDSIFDGAEWYHWSGITPALSPYAAETQKISLIEAKKRGITVSCDLNYRSLLWTEEEARKTMLPLMEYTDVLIANETHARICLGYPVSSFENEDEQRRALRICGELCCKFGFRVCATTFRRSFGASRNTLSAMMCANGKLYEAKTYDLSPITDRVGSGDAFAGGLIHGLLNKAEPQKALDFALAACALKHTVPGDFWEGSENEILSLAEGDGNAVFRR